MVSVSYNYQIPRPAERKAKTLRPSLAFPEAQGAESLAKDPPDPLPHYRVVVEDENSQLVL